MSENYRKTDEESYLADSGRLDQLVENLANRGPSADYLVRAGERYARRKPPKRYVHMPDPNNPLRMMTVRSSSIKGKYRK